MIIKIIPNPIKKKQTPLRRSFANLLHYHDRHQSELVHTENILGSTPTELSSYFEDIAARSSRVKDAVFHAVISFAHDEKDPAPEVISDMAKQYLQNLGYKDQPWVMYRHGDKQHIHYHIITCRVDIKTGRGINSSFEGKRTFEILKVLAPLFGYQVGKGRDYQVQEVLVDQINHDQQKNSSERPQQELSPSLEDTSENREPIQSGLINKINQDVEDVLLNDQPYSMYRFIQACQKRGLTIQRFKRGYTIRLGRDFPIALSKLPVFADRRLSHILKTNKLFRNREMRYVRTNVWQILKSVSALNTQPENAIEMFASNLKTKLSAAGINVIYNTNTSGIAGISFEHAGVTIKGSEVKLSWERILQYVQHKKTQTTTRAKVAPKHIPETSGKRYRTLVAGAGVGKRMSEDEEEKKRKEEQHEI